MKKALVFIIILSLFMPLQALATTMPGTSDYAAILGGIGFIIGLVLSLIIILLHYFIAKDHWTTKKYFILGLSITLGIPLILVILVISI